MFLGNGDGTFQAVVPVPQANRIDVKSVNIADVNGDGYPDLISANGSSYSIALNNKNGTFATPATTNFSAGFVTPADVNGDEL